MNSNPDAYLDALESAAEQAAEAEPEESGMHLWFRIFGRIVFGAIVFGGGGALLVASLVIGVYHLSGRLFSLTY